MDEAELERKKARKRKHVRTFYDRLKIVEEVENNPNEKRVTIAKRLGLSASTLNSIFARKKELREQIQIWGNSCRRKSGKSSTFAELESVLFDWYQDLMASNHRVDGNRLKEKAKIIANDMGIDNFTASNGWVSRFKERHGLTMRKPVIENSIKEDQLDKVRQKPVAWIDSMLSPMEGYEPRDVYSADETGLFFNLLPDRVSSFQGEICPNGKHSKDRLTVLLCVNSDGSDKQIPIVVGKYLKPRCFKTVTEFPTIYHANPNAWMTTKIFYSFLHSLDEQMVRENRQIILFLNERSSHHTTDTPFLRNVKLVHHSEKCTPFDSGILHNFKAHYRKSLLKSMQATHRKHIELLEALQYILSAWQEVSEKTIQSCFRKSAFKFQSDDKEMVNGVDDDDSLFAWEEECRAQNYDFESYVSVDRNVITSGVEVDEELGGMFESAKNANDDNDDGDDDDDDVYEDDDEQKPSFTEVYDALQKIKEFFFLHDGSDKDFENILNLEKSYFHLRQNSAKKMTMKAVEELMMEAKKGKELSERIGIDGWKKSHAKVNKRFLTATIANSISSNNRMKRTKRLRESPQRSPSKETPKTEKKDLKRSSTESNERSPPKKRKSTRPQRFDS